jgi:hypothetical protein
MVVTQFYNCSKSIDLSALNGRIPWNLNHISIKLLQKVLGYVKEIAKMALLPIDQVFSSSLLHVLLLQMLGLVSLLEDSFHETFLHDLYNSTQSL